MPILAPAIGFTNPMTTAKDIIVGGAAGAATRAVAIDEIQAGVLVAGGAAGSDHFTGAALAGAWSTVNSPSLTVVNNSVLTMQGGDNAFTGVIRNYSPGAGALRVEIRTSLWAFATAAATQYSAISIRDSTAVSSSLSIGDAMDIMFNTNTNELRLVSTDASTRTTRQDSVAGLVVPPVGVAGVWFYIRLDRDGANTWTGYFSMDRVSWFSLGTYAKTFTVAQLLLWNQGSTHAQDFAQVDFVDIVS